MRAGKVIAIGVVGGFFAIGAGVSVVDAIVNATTVQLLIVNTTGADGLTVTIDGAPQGASLVYAARRIPAR